MNIKRNAVAGPANFQWRDRLRLLELWREADRAEMGDRLSRFAAFFWLCKERQNPEVAEFFAKHFERWREAVRNTAEVREPFTTLLRGWTRIYASAQRNGTEVTNGTKWLVERKIGKIDYRGMLVLTADEVASVFRQLDDLAKQVEKSLRGMRTAMDEIARDLGKPEGILAACEAGLAHVQAIHSAFHALRRELYDIHNLEPLDKPWAVGLCQKPGAAGL